MPKNESLKETMSKEQWEQLVSMLLKTIEDRDFDLSIKNFKIERLEAEVERLENLLTPRIEDADKAIN